MVTIAGSSSSFREGTFASTVIRGRVVSNSVKAYCSIDVARAGCIIGGG